MSTHYQCFLKDLLPEVNFASEFQFHAVLGICSDSRRVKKGFAFIALRGLRSNGEDFIPSALQSGATLIISEAKSDGVQIKWFDNNQGVVSVALPQLAQKVSALASAFYGYPHRKLKHLVGVTGTNGKSSIVHMLAQAWDFLGEKAASLGTLGLKVGSQVKVDVGMTTPDAIEVQEQLALLVEEGIDCVAMEVSSHGIDQGRVAALKFSDKVLTNITHDHLDYHGSFVAYANTKLGFIRAGASNVLVVNRDDAEITKALLDNVELERVFSYSMMKDSAQIHLKDVRPDAEGFSAFLVSPWGCGEFRSNIAGRFSLSNLLAVVSILCAQGYEFNRVVECVKHLQAAPGRLQKIPYQRSDGATIQVFIDYAHTPDALENVLLSLRPHIIGKLHLVFGCGGDRDASKRAPMGAIAKGLADYIYVTTDNPRHEDPKKIIDDIMLGCRGANHCMAEVDRELAIKTALKNAVSDDAVLIAGKGHENYQIIGDQKIDYSDFDAVRRASSRGVLAS